ncbi:MAG: ferrous iron transport protein B [Candidatus Thermoplasmatota archaeon]|nr:ferrous iron transport protein B [Candidatus Thermoplasmatota archaeon]
MKDIKVALTGIPNSGKTTLFNALTGGFGRTGNWSGVTVDLLEGSFVNEGCRFHVTDLPGTYSLNPGSSDEEIVPRYLLIGDYDLLVVVLDGANLRTSMYLAVQVLESNIPVVLAINKADMMKDRGIYADLQQLSSKLGCPIVPTVSTKNIGITDLKDSLLHETHHHIRSDVMHPMMHDRFMHKSADDEVERPHLHQTSDVNLVPRRPLIIDYPRHIERYIRIIEGFAWSCDKKYLSRFNERFLALRWIEGDAQLRSMVKTHTIDPSDLDGSMDGGDEFILDLIDSRYEFIDEMVPRHDRVSESGIVRTMESAFTSKWLGIPIFAGMLLSVFTLTYLIGNPLSEIVESLFELFSNSLSSFGDTWYVSIFRDGLIPGVGSVLVFFPMIFILFFMISLLENSGYMARGVYVIDRTMARLGLPGRSFIPLVMGFGCNVPAIMASRSIPNLRDRIATIILVPFITCSARLPVLMLLSSIFFGFYAGIIVVSMYSIGVIGLIISSLLITKVILRGDPSPLIMDLPPYSLPSIKEAIRSGSMNMYLFIRKAATVIVVAMVIVWGLTYLGIEDGSIHYLRGQDNDGEEDRLENSFASDIGKLIEPVFSPLGFNWKLVVSLMFGIVAKEIVLGTMGILTGAGEEDIESGIKNNSGLDRSGAFVFLVFFTLYVPCIPAIAVIRKETGSYKWALFSIVYNTGFAYMAALFFKLALSAVPWI